MLKMKNILPVFVMLLFLGLANSAFAQVSCNVASTPVSRDTATGYTEPAGDITFQCIQTGAGGSTAGATITIAYQANAAGGAAVPITNNTTFPTAAGGYNLDKQISVTGAGGVGCPVPTVSGVSNATGQVIVSVGALAPGLNASCSFTLRGVLLGLGDVTVNAVVATVSVNPGFNLLITAGQNTPTVVTQVLEGVCGTGPGCATPESGVRVTVGPGIVPTTGSSPAFSQTFSIAVTENYIDLFLDRATFNGGAASNGVSLLYTFSGIPSGASLTGCTATMTNGGTVTVAGTVASTAPTLLAEVTAISIPGNLTAIDTITLTCTGFSNGTATLPLAAGPITATVTLAPVGTAFSSTGTVLNNPATTGQIPRYKAKPVGGTLTVINIIPLTTHLLFPFVSISADFDTGFAIANTTKDPYGPNAPRTGLGARQLEGPATIAFFPAGDGSATAPAPFCVSSGAGAPTITGITSCTTATPVGLGLKAGGIVSAGSTWVVNGSELMRQVTGVPTTFNGYVFAIANFPFAHGSSFIYSLRPTFNFVSGGVGLVLANPSVTGRAATLTWTTNLVESLGH